MNKSPLRYPGGKSKLYNLVDSIISQYSDTVDTYVEPFAGGASIALKLLENKRVQKIIINDINTGVYSFWDSICNDTDAFLRLLNDTEVTIDNYIIQKQIYENEKAPSLQLGFATFFLNRTNFSGVLNAGPIGGYNQTGVNLIDARYNKNALMKKIETIADNSSNIFVYNLDILDFIKQVEKKKKKIFTYFDPPYYVKGKALYTNFLEKEDHLRIAKEISKIRTPWLLTYDNVPEISEIYKNYKQYEFTLSYTVNSIVNRKGSELLVSSDDQKLKKVSKEIKQKINLQRRIK